MKSATQLATGPRRRRPLGFDASFLTRHIQGPRTTGVEGLSATSSSATPAGPAVAGGNKESDDLRSLLVVVGLFLMGVVPRLVFGVSAVIPLESMVPVKFALVNALADGEESYTIKTGLWVDALVMGAVSFFLVPDPGTLNLLAFVTLVAAILPTMGTRSNLLWTVVPVGMFSYRFVVAGPPPIAAAVDQKLYWTVASCLCFGLCVAQCLRLSATFVRGRTFIGKAAIAAALATYTLLSAVPFLGAVGRVLYKTAGRPVASVGQAMGIKWPIAVALWLGTMTLEWGVLVSEGGIIITGSLLVGFMTSLLEDRRSGTLKGKAFFVFIVLAVNTFVWVVCPSKALPFLANAIISAYLILYIAYLKPTASTRPPASAGTNKKITSSVANADPQVEIYTNLSTVLLMFLWLAMLGIDLTQQVSMGWLTPGLYRMVLSVNTVGYGTVMLVTALFDLVNKELHQGAAATRQQREKVEALSQTLKNSVQNGTKVVLTKGNQGGRPAAPSQDGESSDQVSSKKVKKEDDGGEAAAPSYSATPEDQKTESSHGFDSPPPLDTDYTVDEELTAADNNSGASSTTPATAEDTEGLTTEIAIVTPVTPRVEEPPSSLVETKDSFGSAVALNSFTSKTAASSKSPASPEIVVANTAVPQSMTSASTTTTPAVAATAPSKKKSKVEVERERKEWQEAQLSAVLAETDDEFVGATATTSTMSTTAKPKSKEKETAAVAAKKAKKDAAAAAEKEKKNKEDSLAALRAAAQREQELKEKLETERRDRERKVQEDQQRKQQERERQEAVRQRELEKQKKEQVDLQRKKEKELELQREKEAKAKASAAERKDQKEREKKERAVLKEKVRKEEESAAKVAAAEKHAAEHPALPGAGEAAPSVGPPALVSPLSGGKSMADLLREKQQQKQKQGVAASPQPVHQHVVVTAPIKPIAAAAAAADAKSSKGRKAPMLPKSNTCVEAAAETGGDSVRGGPPMAICSVDDLSGTPTTADSRPMTAMGGLMNRNQGRLSGGSIPTSPLVASAPRTPLTQTPDKAGMTPLPPLSADVDMGEAGTCGSYFSNSGIISPRQPAAVDVTPEQPRPTYSSLLEPTTVFEENDNSGHGTPIASPADSNPMSADDRHNFLFSLLSSSKQQEEQGSTDPLHLTSPSAPLGGGISLLSPTLRDNSDSFIPDSTAPTAAPIGGHTIGGGGGAEDAFSLGGGDDDAFWRNILDTVLSEDSPPLTAGPLPLGQSGLGGPLLPINPPQASPAKTTGDTSSNAGTTSPNLLSQQPPALQLQQAYMMSNGSLLQPQYQVQQPGAQNYFLQPAATSPSAQGAAQSTQAQPMYYMPQQAQPTLYQLGSSVAGQAGQPVYVLQPGGTPAYQQAVQTTAPPPQYSPSSGTSSPQSISKGGKK